MFVLPKKIINEIVATCRKFLWSGEANGSNKALLAWETLCYPKTAGGVNFTDVELWNKVATCKQLWNVCKKNDKLWVRWVHAYYGGTSYIWEAKCNQASWIMQKILKAHKYIAQAGMSMDELMSMNQFSINNIYCKLRGNVPKVAWRRLTCNNQCTPKWNFILLLTAHGRLYTRNKLKRCGVIHDATCPMCGADEESISHLFYVCIISKEVWQKLLQRQDIYRKPMEWDA